MFLEYKYWIFTSQWGEFPVRSSATSHQRLDLPPRWPASFYGLLSLGRPDPAFAGRLKAQRWGCVYRCATHLSESKKRVLKPALFFSSFFIFFSLFNIPLRSVMPCWKAIFSYSEDGALLRMSHTSTSGSVLTCTALTCKTRGGAHTHRSIICSMIKIRG